MSTASPNNAVQYVTNRDLAGVARGIGILPVIAIPTRGIHVVDHQGHFPLLEQ